MVKELIRAENLCFTEDGVSKLHYMDFSALYGQSIGVIGLSGAGKSSLAEILSGEKTCEQGEIWLDERLATSEELKKAGMLINGDSRLIETLSVTDNILGLDFNARTSKLWYSSKKTRNFCTELLREFGLESYIDTKVAMIPVSVQHRILLISSIVRGKKFVTLDHIASDYTTVEQISLIQTISMVCKRKISVFYFVGHIEQVLIELDKICAIKNGRRIKEIKKHEYSAKTLRAYIYGFGETEISINVNKGNVITNIDGIEIRENGIHLIHNVDGSLPKWRHNIFDNKDIDIGFANASDLYNCWIGDMSVIDNLALSLCQKIEGAFLPIRKKLRDIIEADCTAQTGLSAERIYMNFEKLDRVERFSVLTYKLCTKKIIAFEQITAGADIRERAEIIKILLGLEKTIIYISSDYNELAEFNLKIYPLERGSIKHEKNI